MNSSWTVRFPRWDGRDIYRMLQVDTLVLVGRYDFFLDAARRAAAAIPHAELIVLPRSSHLGPLEEPVAFRSAIERFLRRVERAQPSSAPTSPPPRRPVRDSPAGTHRPRPGRLIANERDRRPTSPRLRNGPRSARAFAGLPAN